MPEHPALVAAARFGLPGDGPVVVIDPDDVERVLAVAGVDRLGGFLGRSVEHGRIAVDDDAAAAVAEEWHRELVSSVVVEAMAVRVASILDEAGVEWRLTKGAAVAHLDYRDPSLRTFGDVDLLVHPGSWAMALRVLTGAGFVREATEMHPGFDLRYGKGATLTGADGAEVDLHLRLAIGRFGVTSRPEDLFDAPEPLVLGGRTLPALSSEGRFLHACYHAALGGFRHLRAQRDVAQMVVVRGVDWERVVGRARAWRAEVVVAAAVQEAWQTFGLDPDDPIRRWAAGVHPGRREAAALEVFRQERPFRDQALTSVPVLPWSDRPRYLWYLASSRRRS